MQVYVSDIQDLDQPQLPCCVVGGTVVDASDRSLPMHGYTAICHLLLVLPL